MIDNVGCWMRRECPLGWECKFGRNTLECLETLGVHYRAAAERLRARRSEQKEPAAPTVTSGPSPENLAFRKGFTELWERVFNGSAPPIDYTNISHDNYGVSQESYEAHLWHGLHSFNAGAITQWIMKNDEKETVKAMAKFYPSALRRLRAVIDKALGVAQEPMCVGSECTNKPDGCHKCTRDPLLTSVQPLRSDLGKRRESANG